MAVKKFIPFVCNMKKRYVLITAIIVLAVIIGVMIYSGNKNIEVNKLTVKSKTLPVGFDGFKILHISDLHIAESGRNNQKLLDMVAAQSPDIIATTGDIVDSRRTDIDTALTFAKKAVEIAPVYYVTGNHEARIKECNKLLSGLENAGVTVLRNESIKLYSGEESITLIGIDDPSFETEYLSGDESKSIDTVLQVLTHEGEGFKLLLSHRPELFEVYCKNKINLTICGHAHGGQIRLPFIGGIVAPGQGLFPKYDSGLFIDDDTAMIVSRGLGNSIIPIRINNKPEIIVVTLEKDTR